MAGVSTATGCAANVLSNVFSSLWNKVVEEVKMIISLPRAITRMEKEVQTLQNEIDDINAELRQEQRDPKRIVKTWLDDAGEAIKSSRSIGNKYQAYQQHQNCVGCYPNCLSRYRISRDIREWERNVDQLHKQSKLPPSGEYGDTTPRAQIQIQSSQSGIVASAKRSEDMENLVTWLTAEDSNVRRIGIQGMGGVGKTSLLDAINDSQEVGRSFELIVKVTVSKNKIFDLQKYVADRLKLTSFPENSEGRKDMLRSYLKNKKYILLLDDMWEESMWTSQKLEDLGVSLDDTGFKIVLTTRDKRVCARMNVQKTITVEPLSEDDGWKLFCSRAFENLNGNVRPELEEVARKIAKECKGLPLAIVVVAAAMTPHTDVREWALALTQLQHVDETFDAVNPGVDTDLFQRLKWSYDALKPQLQTCFLYFAAFPEDEHIYCNDVIDTWIAEGIVEGKEDIYLHDIGCSYMSYLTDRCLIEVAGRDFGGRIFTVKVHDILRDLAIRIAGNRHSCYFNPGQGVSDFPVVQEGCAKMSLMYNRLHSLPTTFACSSLTVLLLNKNPDIKEVPESFLHELPSLKVLDLSETGITSLPPSIGNLKHLAYLNLKSCEGLCELPETIGDLNKLQFLNVSFCDQLRCLPEMITELKRLRSLDIKGCKSLSHLPRGISEFVSLETLEMDGSNISLDFEEDANAETKNVCLKDLQSLSCLVHLSVYINSPVKEGVMGNWPKMRSLQMRYQYDLPPDMRYQYDLPPDMQAMKDLESFLLWQCDMERLPSWVSEFRKLAYLDLSFCSQLKELTAELQELPCLREVGISCCDKLKELELGMGFPKLERLYLGGLESLECVRAGTAASGSGGRPSPLPMFKYLDIGYRCSKLKTLSGEWDNLKCLEEIRGQREWWDAIEWEDPNIKTTLESKFRAW